MIVLVLAFIASVAVMFYAAKSSKEDITTTAPVETSTQAAPVIVTEENSSEELTTQVTTIATTQATTETTTVTTTAAPTTVTTTESTTARPVETYTGAYSVYTIKSGDNYYSILRSFGIADTPANVQKMCDFNGISIYTGLTVGETLKVPTE